VNLTERLVLPIRLLDWFDLKSALAGAVVMGGIVGAINAGHGVSAMFGAGLGQGVYTFFFAGLVMQHCRWLAKRALPPQRAVLLATVWPTLLTVVLVYLFHRYLDTPEAAWSTVPPGVLGFFLFLATSRKVVSERG
jgi:hypothetical protein